MSTAKVKTRLPTNSREYPFLIATIEIKYPRPFKSQKNGMANTFTIRGPINGTSAISAVMPVKNCVKTPNAIVTNTTTFFSTPKYNATTIAITNNDHPTKCFQLDLRKVFFSSLSLGLGLLDCSLLLFLLSFVVFAIFLPISDELNLYRKTIH